MIRRWIVPFLIITLLATAFPVVGQEGDDCDLNALSDRLATYAGDMPGASIDEVAAIRDEIDALLAAYLANCAPLPVEEEETPAPAPVEGVLFSVVSTGDLNIRSCGGTNCAVVRSSRGGEVYSVVAQDGEWYEIDLGGGQTGFIAAWLTTRVPDAVIEIFDGYADADLVCELSAEVTAGASSRLEVAIIGDGRSVVTVDVLRPNTGTPEPVEGQAMRRHPETGTPYILQTYRSTSWSPGAYQVHVDRDGVKRVFGFDLNQAGATTITVACF